jgi:hypothetical protein
MRSWNVHRNRDVSNLGSHPSLANNSQHVLDAHVCRASDERQRAIAMQG